MMAVVHLFIPQLFTKKIAVKTDRVLYLLEGCLEGQEAMPTPLQRPQGTRTTIPTTTH